MTKYGGIVLIALALLVLTFRFDIIIELFKGTANVPYYQLLTPIVLIVAGIIVLRLNLKKEKSKKKEQ